MSYRNGINYLVSKTRTVELCNQLGGRVAVCPDWNGRVMTSSCDGLDGTSFGLINVKEIDSNETDSSFAFYGGEDQLTLSPESGPFSLHYPVDAEDRIFADPVPPPMGFHEGPFKIDSLPNAPEVRMRRNLQMTNRAGTEFDLDIVRMVRLIDEDDIRRIFGRSVAVSLEQTDVSYVAFGTLNSLINRGRTHSKSSGLVSFRMRSMFNSSQHAVVVLPFQTEAPSPPVCADFFGMSPHGRLRLLPEAALLRGDGRYRCQVGVPRRRAVSRVGAIDFREGILTLLAFDMPESPWEHDYPSNAYCETDTDFVSARTETNPYSGEVVRAYNHGPTFPGEDVSGRFYEFDVFSPARELLKGDSLVHHQYTVHINADNMTLAYLAKKVLGVDYEQVYEKMMK